MLEVNCESDFVARNEKFRALVTELTLKIASATIVKKEDNEHLSAHNNQRPLKKYPIAGENLAPFNDQVAEAVAQLGEKINVRRATLVENRHAAGESAVRLLSYAHAVGGQANVLNGVALGKYGTLLAYREVEPVAPTPEAQVISDGAQDAKSEAKPADVDPDAFEELEQTNAITADASTREDVAKLICQHIIGCNPKRLDRHTDGKSAADKKTPNEDDGAALLDQRLLVNEAVTVRELCTERGLKLVEFERFECGADAASTA